MARLFFKILITAGLAFSALLGHNTVVANDNPSQQSIELLSEIVSAKSLDSHLRLQELETKISQPVSITALCETLKEAIFLSIDSEDRGRLERLSALADKTTAEFDDPELSVYSQLAKVAIQRLDGNLIDAKAHIAKIRKFAHQTDNENSLFFVDAIDAVIGIGLGNYLDGLSRLTQSTVTLPNTLRGNWMRMQAYLALAYAYSNTGDLVRVIEFYSQAMHLGQQHGIAFDRESAVHNLAGTLADLGQMDIAETFYQGLEEIVRQNGHTEGQYYVYFGLTKVRHQQERYKDVLDLAEKALTGFETNPLFDAKLYALAAFASTKLADIESARSYIKASRSLLAGTVYEQLNDYLLDLSTANILKTEGNPAEAFDLLKKTTDTEMARDYEDYIATLAQLRSGLDSVLEKQQAELELVEVRATNSNLILIFSVLFIIMMLGVLVLQYRHSKQLDTARIEAEHANRTKSEFLANMSHELRTPLNAILGFSEMMSQKVFGDLGAPQYVDYAVYIHDSGTHLLDIINDILDLSKIESGQVRLNEEILDLNTLFEDIKLLLTQKARSKNIDIQIEVPDNIPPLYADRRLAKQILLNLLNNAVKFTPKGGTIKMTASIATGNQLVLSVTDNGPGMSKEELALALTPFGQAGTTLTRSHEGTGLGLPLTKQLMELHGGKLIVHSKTGEGTRADMKFPSSRCLGVMN